MSGFVLDASFTITLCMGEGTSEQADAVWALLGNEGTFVPQIWAAEVRNALLANERRGRISAERVEEWFHILGESPLTTDFNPDQWAALALARAHRLTFYDSLYLELAQRLQATLATLDAALLRAAGSEGVPTAPV